MPMRKTITNKLDIISEGGDIKSKQLYNNCKNNVPNNVPSNVPNNVPSNMPKERLYRLIVLLPTAKNSGSRRRLS